MAKQTVTVCDLPRGIPTMLGGAPPRGAPPTAAPPRPQACDRLASETCGVCQRDVCADHIAFKLEARIATTAPSKIPNQNPPDPILPCVEYKRIRGICVECHMFAHELKSRGGTNFGSVRVLPVIDADVHLTALLDAICAELGAARGAATLADE